MAREGRLNGDRGKRMLKLSNWRRNCQQEQKLAARYRDRIVAYVIISQPLSGRLFRSSGCLPCLSQRDISPLAGLISQNCDTDCSLSISYLGVCCFLRGVAFQRVFNVTDIRPSGKPRSVDKNKPYQIHSCAAHCCPGVSTIYSVGRSFRSFIQSTTNDRCCRQQTMRFLRSREYPRVTQNSITMATVGV
jgi:hypothetical protein